MKNKKGFTLVELLGVIVLLSVLAVGSGAIIVKSMKSSKEKSMFIAAQEIESIAEAAIEVEKSAVSGDCITIEALVNLGYLKTDVSNPRTIKEDGKWEGEEQKNTKVCLDSSKEKQDNYKVNDHKYTFDGYYYQFDTTKTIN